MPKIVELPDGREAEFPDSMDNEAIGAVLRKQFGPKQAATPPGQIPIDPNAKGPAPLTPQQRFGGSSITDQIGGGIASALNRTAIGLKGLLPGVETTDDDRRRLEQHREFVQGTGPASTVGEVGADVAMSALPVAKAAQAGSVLARTLGARGAAPLIGDVAANAAYSAATAPEDRGSAAAWGGGGAAAGRGIGRMATGIVKPTDEAAALLQQGVRLTPGQAGGKGSAVNWLEQLATSNPVTGYPINAARSRALQDANVAAAQAVASHVDSAIKLDRAPAEAIEQVRQRISQVYDDVLPRLSLPRGELVSLTDQIVRHVPDDAALVGKRQREKLADYLDRRILGNDAALDSEATGDLLKQVDVELGSYARTLAKSTNAEERVASPMWYDAQQKWREYVMKAAAPDSNDFAMLSQANAAYRELLVIEKALKASGGETIKPRALAKTLESMGIKSGKLATLSKQMDSTLPSTLPDSGTAARVLGNSMPAMLAGGTAAAMGGPVLATGAAAAALMGTQTGARALTGLTIPQKALVNMLVNRGLSQTEAEQFIKMAAAQGGRASATQQ